LIDFIRTKREHSLTPRSRESADVFEFTAECTWG
jgi:hypothetical protein